MGVRSDGGFSGNNEPRLRGMAFFRGGVAATSWCQPRVSIGSPASIIWESNNLAGIYQSFDKPIHRRFSRLNLMSEHFGSMKSLHKLTGCEERI